jgi:hypothetical protein
MPERLGWISSELLIEDTLTAGYAALDAILPDDAAADAFLTRVFWNAGAERRSQYRTWLRRTELSQLVIENYPRLEQRTPCQAILMLPGESHEFVGNTGPEVLLESGATLAIAAEAWRESIGVMTFAEHPEQLLVLHQLAKFFLAARRLELSAQFELGFSMAQRDLNIAQAMLPRFVYHRVLQVNVEFLQLNAADVEAVDIADVVAAQEAAYAGAGA